MNDKRFYIDSVHGYANASRHDKRLWYVFDSVPPRRSRCTGYEEVGLREAIKLCNELNRRLVQ